MARTPSPWQFDDESLWCLTINRIMASSFTQPFHHVAAFALALSAGAIVAQESTTPRAVPIAVPIGESEPNRPSPPPAPERSVLPARMKTEPAPVIGTAPNTPGAPASTEDSADYLHLKNQIVSAFPAGRHFTEAATTAIANVYRDRGFRPLWDDGALNLSFTQALEAELERHAFPSLLISDPELILQSIPDGSVDKRDLAYTIAFMDTACLIRLGSIAPDEIWEDWNKGDTPGSDEASLEELSGDLVRASSLQPTSVPEGIEIMARKNWVYKELQKAYPAAKEGILKYTGLPSIPDPSNAGVGRPGEAYPYAPALAAHLIDRGYLDLPGELASSLSSMTPELVAALTAFQGDYGLDTDGIFGSSSWQYLNWNAAERYRAITLNMHRARILPADMGNRYVISNLPSAELYAFDENDFHKLTMRVVHGRASKDTHRTKIFRDTMQEVVFGPYWNVPKSIAVKEILPKAQADWGFLSRNRYEIVSSFNPYSKSNHRLSPANLELVSQGKLFLRQKPGPTNALGHVKFLFPNSFNIYMHDTPSKTYFARSKRDHSHGCVRVAKPESLGEWVLSPEGWTGEKVKEAMFADERKSLAIKEEINVYIIYLTAFPRPVSGGKIVMAPGRDVYERDQALAAKLGNVIPWNAPTTPAPVSTAQSGGQ